MVSDWWFEIPDGGPGRVNGSQVIKNEGEGRVEEGDQTVGGDISKIEREYTNVTERKRNDSFDELEKLERKGVNGIQWRWLSRKRRK